MKIIRTASYIKAAEYPEYPETYIGTWDHNDSEGQQHTIELFRSVDNDGDDIWVYTIDGHESPYNVGRSATEAVNEAKRKVEEGMFGEGV